MSKWKVYALYFADWDDPFDRCYCGKWRFQGVAYAETAKEACDIVQKRKGKHGEKRREAFEVLWGAEWINPRRYECVWDD